MPRTSVAASNAALFLVVFLSLCLFVCLIFFLIFLFFIFLFACCIACCCFSRGARQRCYNPSHHLLRLLCFTYLCYRDRFCLCFSAFRICPRTFFGGLATYVFILVLSFPVLFPGLSCVTRERNGIELEVPRTRCMGGAQGKGDGGWGGS